MKGFIKPALATTVLLAGAYLLATFFVGKQVEREIERVQQELTARTDVRTVRFDYERGFASGVLHYNLVLAPQQEASSPRLEELMLFLSEGGLSIIGSVDVLHGPLLGRSGLGFAKAEWSLPWPEELLKLLSGTTTSQPMLTATTILPLFGQLRAHVVLADFSTTIPDSDSDNTLALDLAGIALELRTNRSLDKIDLHVTLDQITVIAEGFSPGKFEIRNSSLSAQLQQYSPYLWTGDSVFSADLISVQSSGARLEIGNIAVDTHTGLEQGNLSAKNIIKTGPVAVNDFILKSTEFVASAGNISTDAYATMLRATNEVDADAEDLLLASEQLLLGRPWFAIDTWRVSVLADNDISGHMRIQLPEVVSLDEALQGLSLDQELRVSTAALRELARIYVQTMSEVTLTEPRLTQEADQFYDDSLQLLQAVPGLQIRDESIALSVAVRDGHLLVDGQAVLDVSPWLRSNIWFGNDGQVSANIVLDTLAEPYFGRTRLQTGFTPDPWELEMIAGGAKALTSVILQGEVNGNCVGYINAERPDLALNFTAGTNSLFVYTSSDADSTIIVRDPSGNWHCNDDAPGLAYNAGVRFTQPLSGQYLIWGGTYNGAFAETVVLVSESGFVQ